MGGGGCGRARHGRRSPDPPVAHLPLALFRQVLETNGEPRVRGIALQNIGSILAQQGSLGAAERAFAESLGYFRRAGYQLGEATALNNQGRVALDRGDAEL